MIKDNPLYQEHEAAKGAQWAKDELAKRALVERTDMDTAHDNYVGHRLVADGWRSLPTKRADIATRYGVEFNPGNWLSGHVSLENVVVAFVTLDGAYAEAVRLGGRAPFSPDDNQLVWASQNSTTPESKKGREMISGKPFDFWVRESKRKNGGKFQLAGRFQYVSHTGSKPMRVIFERVEEYDPAEVLLVSRR